MLKFSIFLSRPLVFRFSEFPGIKYLVNYFDPNSGVPNKNLPKQKRKIITKESEPKGICCVNCHAGITHAKNAIEVEGRHQHTVTNPSGITFRISMYAQVNCNAHSVAISEFSWFTGYDWRIVTCPGCQQHLGWSYQKGHSPDFYGLISDKLIDFDK